jgi:hypothetical protein
MPDQITEPNGSNPKVNTEGDANTQLQLDKKAAEGAEPKGTEPNRLLEESKKWKERAVKAEKELEAKSKAEQAEKGQYKDLYEKEQEKFSNLRKSFLKEKINSSVSVVATKHGCVDTDALLRLGNLEHLQFDEDTGMVHGVDTFVEETKKARPFLFNQAKPPTINPTAPGGQSMGSGRITKENFGALKPEQKSEVYAQLLSKMKQ